MEQKKEYKKKGYKVLQHLLLAGYLLLIAWLMLGNGRVRYAGYACILHVYPLPLSLPREYSRAALRGWLLNAGNLLAFMPFGALLPMNFPRGCGRFWRALPLFILGITGMETLQLITRLGCFDVMDIIINTIGFSLGYLAWKVSGLGRGIAARITLFGGTAAALALLCLAGAPYCNALLFPAG